MKLLFEKSRVTEMNSAASIESVVACLEEVTAS